MLGLMFLSGVLLGSVMGVCFTMMYMSDRVAEADMKRIDAMDNYNMLRLKVRILYGYED